MCVCVSQRQVGRERGREVGRERKTQTHHDHTAENPPQKKTYAKSFDVSPMMTERRTGAPMHMGTRYSRAGCAALKKCMTKMVSISPRKYATYVKVKYSDEPALRLQERGRERSREVEREVERGRERSREVERGRERSRGVERGQES